MVFVSHRLAEVLEISSRVTVLRDGKLVGVFPTEGMTQSLLTELMTGKSFDQAISAGDRTGSPVVLTVSGLTRHGEFRDVSFSIRKGETVGLTGLLGAGRTELALSIFGMRRPDSGTISIDGAPVDLRSNRDAIRAGIAYLSEDRLSLGLIQPQSVADNLVLPVLDRILEHGLISRRRKRSLVRRWIDDLAIKVGLPEDPVSTLSGGNQQRVAIAKWLATEPRLLILDCPTVGVDVGARAGIFEIIHRLARAGTRDPADFRRSAGGVLQRRSCAAYGGRPDCPRVRPEADQPRRPRESCICLTCVCQSCCGTIRPKPGWGSCSSGCRWRCR